MNYTRLEEALLEATDGAKIVPSRSFLVDTGLTDTQAKAFSSYLKGKGFVVITDLKKQLKEEAAIQYETTKLRILIKLQDALSN
jgi:hypothetical protein